MDVAIIDAVWNGVGQSMKIAAVAEAYEVNVAPHNFYGHLSTMMNAQLVAAVPNFRIMEIDIDEVPWRGEIFTSVPQIEGGHLILPKTPGWGTEPDEGALKTHPGRQTGGEPCVPPRRLLNQKRDPLRRPKAASARTRPEASRGAGLPRLLGGRSTLCALQLSLAACFHKAVT